MANLDDAIKVTVDGITVTSGAASARSALPVNAAGTTARVIRVKCSDPVGYAYVLPGNSSVVATTASLSIGNYAEYLDVTGCTHIAYIQGSAAAVINIVPVEW
jgi:hypothetical protein